jgi:hypothetical protein
MELWIGEICVLWETGAVVSPFYIYFCSVPPARRVG